MNTSVINDFKVFFPLSAYYPSQIGGPCNTLYWHCCALKDNGVNPSVFTTSIGIDKDKIKFNEWLRTDCGNVYYSTKGVFSFNTLKNISEDIACTDILHLNSLFGTFSIFSFFYRAVFHLKKPIIWSVRGELNTNALKFSSWKKKPILFLYKMFNKNIIYHSTSKQETLGIKRMFPKNEILEIPNLVKPFKRLNLDKKKQLLFVGRIHPIKNIHKLIEAVSLSKVFMENDFQLVIAGKEEDRHKKYLFQLKELAIKLKIKEKIIFIGHVEGIEKEELYSASQALILPSETENFGNVVVESLRQGTPVIASLGTPWEDLEKYNAGIHVSNKPAMLAVKLDELLSKSNEDYLTMCENSIRLVDEKYNIDSKIGIWINTYQRILNSN